jgi:hypothetical protein
VPQFAFAENLQNACKYCATIARARTADWWKQNLVREPGDPTATVTFIRIEGRTYAVTAWHMIKIFREVAAEDGVDVEGYFLPAKPGVGIGPPFVQAPPPWTAPRPDVAEVIAVSLTKRSDTGRAVLMAYLPIAISAPVIKARAAIL